ncbi:anhydro-N-acetylmuramic acid kinase [Nereida ignava]|uniref:anhydro-N-acetylmuramic acid kinase n=2 Tax=Nereida TaxID=282198 RepID=UPI00399C15F0
MIRSVGAMSGTSLDGVDTAMVLTDGVRIAGFGESGFRAYTAAEQDVLRSRLGCWPEDDLADVAELVETVHAQALSDYGDAELFGFHGQTLSHDPANRRTFQIGDGQVLADVLNAPVVWDFRSADVELGGQGAPLAPFYHFALAKHIGAQGPVAFLNLGGVGNVTWVDPLRAKPEDSGALLAFDTGPANAPINDVMQRHFGKTFDENGETARSGTVDDELVHAFMTHPYFSQLPPKSLDRDSFRGELSDIEQLRPQDAVATLTVCAAAAVTRGVQFFPEPVSHVYVCGGGRRNTYVMELLAQSLDAEVVDVDHIGIDGDMLEAQAFAYLAVRVARGMPTSCTGTTGVAAAVGGGIVSRPSSAAT